MGDDRYYIRNRVVEACRWSGDAILSVNLNSGYESHRPFLSFVVWKLWLSVKLPKWIIHPRRTKVQAQSWDAATVARMGRDWYYDETRREFGLILSPDSVRVHYGVQPDCYPGDKSKAWYFPWMEWRYMGQRWYGLKGELCATLSEQEERGSLAKTGRYFTELRDELVARVPKAIYEVEDFDGTRIRATTKIEEREWHLGKGWFKWLTLLGGKKVRRSLDISFDKEVGYEKGSWKGGLVGSGIDMNPGELHEAAMRRFCAAGVRNKSGISKLTFIGPA